MRTSSSIPSIRAIGRDIQVLKQEVSNIEVLWAGLKPMNIIQYAENIAYSLQKCSLRSEQISQNLKDFTAQCDASFSDKKRNFAFVCAILDYRELRNLKNQIVTLCKNIDAFYYKKKQTIDQNRRAPANNISDLDKLKGITNNFKIFKQIKNAFNAIQEYENSHLVRVNNSLKQIEIHPCYPLAKNILEQAKPNDIANLKQVAYWVLELSEADIARAMRPGRL